MKLALDHIDDPEVRAEVKLHLKRARAAMIATMGLKSLPLVVAAVLVGAITWVMGTTRDLLFRADRSIGEKIQMEAEAC